MEHYLIDTNIIIDMLLDRESADAACAVIDGAEQGKYRLYMCALSMTNIYYSIRKYMSHEERINCLIQLREVIDILPVSAIVLDNALHSEWKDFEDAVQYYSAKLNPTIKGIITRNEKDFKLTDIKILSSYDFL